MRKIININFSEAIEDSRQCKKRHLLLGNGFSIACRPDIFTYGSLFEQANFSSAPRLQDIFKSAGTTDFEHVIKLLDDASHIVPVYSPNDPDIATMMASDSDKLKDILIKTVATNHPEFPGIISDVKFIACRKFLAHFLGNDNKNGKVYTLNYDLLLYWTLLQDNVDRLDETIKLETDDGFGRDEQTPNEYVVWKGESSHYQRVHYLHGALHLFDSGVQLQKYTWKNTNIRLLEQARDAMNNGHFPLFVAEGRSEQKLAKIKHSAYLYHSYKSFSTQMNQRDDALFVFGHSLSQNDQHIMDKIAQGKFSHIYVGIHRNQSASDNRKIIDAVTDMARQRSDDNSLEVAFFDAASARVWGD